MDSFKQKNRVYEYFLSFSKRTSFGQLLLIGIAALFGIPILALSIYIFKYPMVLVLLLGFLIIFYLSLRSKKKAQLIPEIQHAPEAGVKKCPYCFKEVDTRATKCPYCQSSLSLSQEAISKQKRKTSPLTWAVLIIILFFVAIAIFSASNNNPGPSSSNSNLSQSSTSNDFAVQISNKTGESVSDIKNALAIVGRYNLDSGTINIVVDDAAMLAAMRSSHSNSSQLQFLGFGDLMQTADTFAQIAQAWKFNSSTAQHNFDALLSFATQTTIKWPQFSTALIKNGPKFNGYANFVDAAASLSVMSKDFSSDVAVEIFNMVGDATADPNDKINIALGSPGYIGRVVKKDGIPSAVEAISNYIKQNSH